MTTASYLEVTPTGLQLPDALAQIGDYGTIVVREGIYEFDPLLPTTETWQAHGDGGAAMTLAYRRGVRIIGDGNALLQFTPGNGLCLLSCEGIEVSGLTFVGSGYTTTPEKWYFALLLLAGTNAHIRIHHCAFRDSGNHGIGHLMGGSTNDSVFEKCVFERGGHLNRPADIEGQPALGGDGAALAVRGSRNSFRGNLIVDWLRGIEIEAKDNEASNNVVEGNELRNVFWHGIFITPTGGDASLCRRNTIQRNVITSGAGMGNFTMAHPIYVSGGHSHSIDDNDIRCKPGDWCGIDATANHCDLTPWITRNRVFGGRFGIGLGFNDAAHGELAAIVGWNELDSCEGAGIGYLGRTHSICANRIGTVVPRAGIQQAIYSPDDPHLTCCWDNQI